MANRDFKEVKALEREVILLAGVSTIGGSGAVTSTNGSGFSVAKGGTGIYNITLEDNYQKFLYIGVQFEEADEGSTDQFFAVIDTSAASSGTAVVKIDNGAGTIVEPDSGAKLHFFMVLKNSSVT